MQCFRILKSQRKHSKNLFEDKRKFFEDVCTTYRIVWQLMVERGDYILYDFLHFLLSIIRHLLTNYPNNKLIQKLNPQKQEINRVMHDIERALCKVFSGLAEKLMHVYLRYWYIRFVWEYYDLTDTMLFFYFYIVCYFSLNVYFSVFLDQIDITYHPYVIEYFNMHFDRYMDWVMFNKENLRLALSTEWLNAFANIQIQIKQEELWEIGCLARAIEISQTEPLIQTLATLRLQVLDAMYALQLALDLAQELAKDPAQILELERVQTHIQELSNELELIETITLEHTIELEQQLDLVKSQKLRIQDI